MEKLNDQQTNQDVNWLSQEQMQKSLTALYGPMLSGVMLRKAMGFPSASALRMALKRGQLSVPIFEIPSRRGKFALTQDVAAWLVKCRAESALSKNCKANV